MARCISVIPPSAKILFLGEAPGEQEEIFGVPFVGYSGQELTRIMSDAGIPRANVGLLNVFSSRPPGNEIRNFCASKAEVVALAGGAYSHPPLEPGKYIKPEFLHELERVKQEIISAKPNLVVALGNTALWALCGCTGITKFRGAITESSMIPGLKVLPTFHPASVLRNWSQRVMVVQDLLKARLEGEFPEIRYPKREIWIEPTLQDLDLFYKTEILPATILGLDLETIARKHISCVGFAPTPNLALVVPFLGERNQHYWNLEEEFEAWEFVRMCCEYSIAKATQNGLYEAQYLATVSIRVLNLRHDTMICHHALHPELPKSLGFQGSVYCNDRAWKELRPDHRDELKREDI
jgi:uracil-DNA glycosylase